MNPLITTLSSLNFHQRQVVSRYRDSQLKVGENYSYLLNFRLENKLQMLLLKHTFHS